MKVRKGKDQESIQSNPHLTQDIVRPVIPSSHQRRFDGALKRRAKRHQSVTKLD